VGRYLEVRLCESGDRTFHEARNTCPRPTARVVAIVEIVGGLLLMSGFLTRLVAIPFVVEMAFAMLTTKIALYLGTSPLPLPPSPPQAGIWAVLHEIRSEYAQMMCLLFLLTAGPGPWSIDGVLVRLRARPSSLPAAGGSTHSMEPATIALSPLRT
jgi:putative oxidoreductase